MQTTHPPEVRPSDVIAFALSEGIEATLAAFPEIDEHRTTLQRLVDADAELTALEQRAKEAQSRLDAVDRELSALITAAGQRAS
jgi:hypothetical protein